MMEPPSHPEVLAMTRSVHSLVLLFVCTPIRGDESLPLQGHEREVTVAAFSPDGKFILTASDDGTLVLSEAAGRKHIRTLVAGAKFGSWGNGLFSDPLGVLAACFSTDSSLIASASADGVVRLWETATGKEVRTIRAHKMLAGGVAFAPDGKTLATAGHDGVARLWEVRTGQLIRTFRGHPHWVTAVAFSREGKFLYTGGVTQSDRFPNCIITESDDVLAWEVGTGKRLPSPGGKAHQLSLGPDGQTLVLSALIATYTPGGHRGQILIGNIDIDTEPLVTLRGPAAARDLLTLPRHGTAVALTANGARVATASGSLKVLMGKDALGNFVVGNGCFSEVILTDSRSRQPLLKLPHRNVSALAFSPDGSALVTGDSKGIVRLWDLTPGQAWRQKNPSDRELARLWEALAGPDALLAYRAEWGLAAAGDRSVSFLAERLSARAAVGRDRLASLVADLDARSFAVRQKAMRELSEIGPLAESALRAALDKGPSLEVRRRIEELLSNIHQAPDTQTLRALRAVDALERIGSAEARRIMEKLSRGAERAPETEAARAALARLKATRR
jgi:WD40 repeat protein